MKNRKFAASATAALSAGILLATLGGVVQAQALTSSVGGVVRATASYNSTVNVLSLTDNVVDGYGARSHWSTSGGFQGIFDNVSGGGTTKTKSIPGSFGTFRFNVCSKDGNTELACSGYSTVPI
jgi:hypothetical protein